MKLKHVIWDWNGTLLDDRGLARSLINRMLEKRGIESLTEERYLALMGMPIEKYYQRAGFVFSEEPYEELAAEWVKGYLAGWKETRLRQGALEALKGVRERGYTQSVLTATRQSLIEEQARYFGVTEYFEAITGTGDYLAHGKAHLGKAHLEALGLAPQEALLVGDTDHDAETACEMGSPCMLLTGGQMDEIRLRATGCPVLARPVEIVMNLEKRI